MASNALLDPFLSRIAAIDRATIDPQRLAATLNVAIGDMAKLAGVNRSSLSRNPGSPEVQKKLGAIATILARAASMSSVEKAVLWFRYQPIPALGRVTPAELVAKGQSDTVIRYLDALEHGSYA